MDSNKITSHGALTDTSLSFLLYLLSLFLDHLKVDEKLKDGGLSK